MKRECPDADEQDSVPKKPRSGKDRARAPLPQPAPVEDLLFDDQGGCSVLGGLLCDDEGESSSPGVWEPDPDEIARKESKKALSCAKEAQDIACKLQKNIDVELKNYETDRIIIKAILDTTALQATVCERLHANFLGNFPLYQHIPIPNHHHFPSSLESRKLWCCSCCIPIDNDAAAANPPVSPPIALPAAPPAAAFAGGFMAPLGHFVDPVVERCVRGPLGNIFEFVSTIFIDSTEVYITGAKVSSANAVNETFYDFELGAGPGDLQELTPIGEGSGDVHDCPEREFIMISSLPEIPEMPENPEEETLTQPSGCHGGGVTDSVDV